jgi:hypothetical protein
VHSGSPVRVTNKALTSNIATLTTGTAHGLVVGDSVAVSGVDATFNGTHVIRTVTSTTFTYARTAANVTSVALTRKCATSRVADYWSNVLLPNWLHLYRQRAVVHHCLY